MAQVRGVLARGERGMTDHHENAPCEHEEEATLLGRVLRRMFEEHHGCSVIATTKTEQGAWARAVTQDSDEFDAVYGALHA